MSIGTALFACFISAFITYMAEKLIEHERDRKAAEERAKKAKRKAIEREFERQMYNLEEFGNIEGRVICIDRKRKDRAV
jgi:hypothetical protein